jgi:hypothetical protein
MRKVLLLSLAPLAYLMPQAVAQDAQMPADCLAIAAQIQTEIHVRFVHTRSISTLKAGRLSGSALCISLRGSSSRARR